MRVLCAFVAATVCVAADATAEQPPVIPADLEVDAVEITIREVELVSNEADLDDQAEALQAEALQAAVDLDAEIDTVDYDAEIETVCHACGCGDAELGCCEDACCGPVGCCGDCGGGCCCRPSWLAGLEASLVWASVDGFRGSTETRDVVNDITTTTGNNFAEGDGFTATPRLWLTHVKGCWGFSVRYWNFSRGEHDINVFFPPADRFGYSGSGNLDAFTLDLLAERYCGNACSSRTTFFGVRHADVEASQSLIQSERINTTDTQIASSLSRYRVDGTGPTFGMVFRRRMAKHPNWNTFARVGGSVLFGDGFAQSAASTLSDSGAANVQDYDANFGDDSAVLYIGEVQLGVERLWALKCAPMNVFFRVAGEYQYWGSDSDARAGASAASAITGSSTAAATAIANDLDLHFFGVTIGTGLTW